MNNGVEEKNDYANGENKEKHTSVHQSILSN